MQELIQIQSKPAILSVNFEELKKHLAAQLEKYDVVVTAETLKDAKALATELNTTKRIIDTRRKDEVAKASEPVKQFDASMKELVSMCENGRQKLLTQVQRFEDETRQLAMALLMNYRAIRWDELKVPDEFRRANVGDLAIVTAVTGKGALALSAKRSVDERVMADKSLQDQTERRLLLLENKSLKAGLVVTLTRDHVNSFLLETDEAYQAHLDRIIASEIRRQDEAEERLRVKIDREQAREREAEAARAQQQEQEATPEPAQEVSPIAQNEVAQRAEQQTVAIQSSRDNQASVGRESNMVTCFIVCNFELQVDARADEQLIQTKFIRNIQEAGFQSLISVHVQKQKAAA